MYEEEDFEIRDYEYTLEPDMSNSKSCFMLKEAEDDLIKKIKSGQDTSEETPAIVNRLKFLRLMLQSLVAIWPDKNLSPTQIEMVEIQKLLSGAIDVMPAIKKSISLGTQPNGNVKCFQKIFSIMQVYQSNDRRFTKFDGIFIDG